MHLAAYRSKAAFCIREVLHPSHGKQSKEDKGGNRRARGDERMLKTVQLQKNSNDVLHQTMLKNELSLDQTSTR